VATATEHWIYKEGESATFKLAKEIIKAKRAKGEQASSVCIEDLAPTEDGPIPTETDIILLREHGRRKESLDFQRTNRTQLVYI
jgi:hypothetical protein